MKKLLASILTLSLIFSPVGNVVFHDHTTTVEAKSYKSGKRSFNTNRSNTGSFFQNRQNKSTSTYKSSSYKKPGGFFRGLMVGGLAGMLFGSMFANMGVFGSFLGLLINVIGIFILISIIRRLFSVFRRNSGSNQWRR